MKRDKLKKSVSNLVTNPEVVQKADEIIQRRKNIIARMPKVGNGIEMNGLAYAVEYVNHNRGMVHLHFVGEVPVQMPEVMSEVVDSA